MGVGVSTVSAADMEKKNYGLKSVSDAPTDIDITDKKVYDSGVTDDYTDPVGVAYIDSGAPYTISKDDMDDKSLVGLFIIACEVKGEGGGCAGYAAYNINGGADVAIGNDGSGGWVAKNVANVVLKIGDVIQYRKKASGAACGAGTREREITQTHQRYYTLYGSKSDIDDK